MALAYLFIIYAFCSHGHDKVQDEYLNALKMAFFVIALHTSLTIAVLFKFGSSVISSQ